MTVTERLEEEILLWALDGDTINNLIPYAKSKIQVDCGQVLSMVREIASNGLLRVYIESNMPENNHDVDPQQITQQLLANELYVTLTKTDRTLERLAELRHKANDAKP